MHSREEFMLDVGIQLGFRLLPRQTISKSENSRDLHAKDGNGFGLRIA